MRLLSIEYPWNISVPNPRSHWLSDTYHALLTRAHSGVHPSFKLAAGSLYHRSVRKNLQYRNASLELLNDSPLRSRLCFLCLVQVRPLVKFTEYHSQELNALESNLLPEIYSMIRGIRRIKRSILLGKPNATLRAQFESLKQPDVFRLLSLLAQVAFKKMD